MHLHKLFNTEFTHIVVIIFIFYFFIKMNVEMKNLCHDNDSVKGCSEALFHLHRSKAASEPPLIRG